MPTGWRRLTLMWQAAGGNGRLALFVDGVLATELVGLANAGQRVAGVDWGVVGGDLAGAAGFLEIDGFRSW
jgi:hypothetical protein